jgi:hypothetical protein
MKIVKKIMVLCLVGIFILEITGTYSVRVKAAQSDLLHNSTTKNQIFAVPEGGWSTITAKVDYFEYYNPSGSNNNFTSRSKMAVYVSSGATSTPYITLGNVIHSNNKSFTSWSPISIIYDGSKWDDGFGEENTDSVTYSATTSVTGTLAFLLICDDAVIPIVSGSVTLALKTK